MDFPKHSTTDRAILLLKEIENLQAQTELMEISVKEAQLAFEDRVARMQEQHNRELSSLRAALAGVVESARAENEALRAHIRELESGRQPSEHQSTGEMTTNVSDQQCNAASDIEQSLRTEIERLLHEAREKHQILQDRNDQLVRAKAELDKLQERVTQLESARSRTQSESERVQTEFQAQLALLQAELSQKEWALEEKQAITGRLEQKYRREIDALRRELANRQLAIQPGGAEFDSSETLSQAQQHKFEAVQEAEFQPEQLNLNKSRRRWLSGFGRKRRWHQ
jgi:chromosome segregation ATPase